MSQVFRPTTDTTNTTTGTSKWAVISPGTGTLFSNIDENDAADSPITGIRVNVPDATTGSVYVSKLVAPNVQTPTVKTRHKYRYAFRIDPALLGTTYDTDFTVELRVGYVSEGALGTLVHTETWNAKAGGNATPGSQIMSKNVTLTETEANLITDYSDIWLRLVAKKITEADTVDLYFFYFIAPAVFEATSNVKRNPKGPLWYTEVATAGSVNGYPMVQLYNTGSKKAILREIYFIGGNGDGGSTSLCRNDIVSVLRLGPLVSGVGPGGNTTTPNVIRLDDDGAAATPGLQVKAFDFTDDQFTGIDLCEYKASSFFEVRPGNSQLQGDLPTVLRSWNSFPFTVMPTTAYQFVWRFNGAQAIRVFVVWEEVPTR